MNGVLVTWLNERMGLDAVQKVVQKKDVPVHRHTFWYYWGGMTLFLFSVQVGTGILLLLYYRASADEAFESVRFIMTQVQFGWLIRSIHSWAANLMVGVAMIHMFSVFLLKSYRKPREVTWLSGMVLLGLSMAFGFSGYLLPWNQLSLFATKVGTDITGALPFAGEFMRIFLLGGEHLSGGTLTRFFGFHVAVLPAVTTVLLVVHLYLVQRHGMSVPPSIEQTGRPVKRMPFVPNFLLRDAVGWLAALALLALLAALFPWELGEKADPFAPAPAGIKPEWYFAWMFQTLKMLPAHILSFEGEVLGILGIGLAGLLWTLAPFLDDPQGLGRRGRIWTAIGALGLLYVIVFTVLTYVGGGGH